MCRRFESAPRHHSPRPFPSQARNIQVFRISGDSNVLVPKVGVEPTRAKAQRFLRPSRLPFRHFGTRLP